MINYIVGIICDYLPIYEYNDNPPTQYKVVGGSAMLETGIYEAMDWISQQSKNKKN